VQSDSLLGIADRYVEDSKSDLLKLASKLVRIPSENIMPYGYEKEAQDYLYDYLKKLDGIELDYFTPIEVEGIENHPACRQGRNYKDRPNVVAVRKGSRGNRSVIFSSHIDTVSQKPLPWIESKPFSGKISDGKLYGRGAFDMKGALASTIMVLKIISDNKIFLKGDLIVESVVDEENAGSNGTLASRLKGYNADVAILPEPSLLDICPACKGGKVYRISLKGRAGTGYGGELISNPVYGLSLIAYNIFNYEKMINKNPHLESFYYKEEKNPRTVILDKVQAGDLDVGGNIGIPSEAWFSIFINTMPGFTEEMLDKELKAFVKNIVKKNKDLFTEEPEVTGVTRYLWPFEVDRNNTAINELALTYKAVTKEEPVITGAKFACDGFIFNNYFSIPTIIFGPRGGNAHAQDEYVLVEDLVLLAKIFLYFSLKWCN